MQMEPRLTRHIQPHSELRSRTSPRGFTLVELLITVAVASVLLGVAAPSFQTAMRTNRIAALTNDLVASLQLARSEAVMRGARVTLCTSQSVTSATPACSAAADWQDGWLVFLDGSTEGTLDGTDLVLAVGLPASSGSISGGTNFAHYVSYMPSGVSDGSSTSDGDLTVCIAPDQRTLSLSNTGRVSVKKGTCS
jgi:type IV fimbrial biogenesis protein FimT